MMTDSIKAPEGINLLLENLWLRHKAGMQQRHNKVFMVDLPPLTEDERKTLRKKRIGGADYTQEELFGAFI